MAEHKNWAGNYRYQARGIVFPRSVDELRETVRDAAATGGKLRPLGSRHSFNGIADSDGTLVSLEHLETPPRIDTGSRTVRVHGGIRYGTLAKVLQEKGYALHNLASLPHISVAGAVATGTHGSGDANGNLATAVTAVELIDGNGELRTFTRGEPDFDGVVTSLGYAGIVSAITLDIQPSFEVAQYVFQNLPWPELAARFDRIMASAYSVSLFTNWGTQGADQVWLKTRIDENPSSGRTRGGTGASAPAAAGTFGGGDFFDARPAGTELHPLPGISAVNCTPQLGSPVPWSDGLPHFKMGFTPSNGDEIQTEYMLPRTRAIEAFEVLRSMAGRIQPLLQVSEIRSMAADALWLSPAYGVPTIGIHFTWKPLQKEVEALLPDMEKRLAPLGVRPHWGKVFDGRFFDFETLYPKLGDFRNLVRNLDSAGTFRNAFGAIIGL